MMTTFLPQQYNTSDWHDNIRQSYVSHLLVIIIMMHISCQTKVGDLHDVVLGDQYISSSNVTMYALKTPTSPYETDNLARKYVNQDMIKEWKYCYI